MRTIASGLLPRAYKKVLQLFRGFLHRVKFVGVKQSTRVGFRLTCKLVYYSGDNVLLPPRVFKLTRTTKGSLKDIRHVIVISLVEMMAYGVGNCRFARTCITGQQEDPWTVRRWILRPMVNTVKDGDACPQCASPARRCSRTFEIGVVESLGRARPVVQLKSLEKMSNCLPY